MKVAGANGEYHYYKKMTVNVPPSLSRSGYQYTLYRLVGTLGGSAPNGGDLAVLDGRHLNRFSIQEMDKLVASGHATAYAGGMVVTVKAVINGEVRLLRYERVSRMENVATKDPRSIKGGRHFVGYEYQLAGEVSDPTSTLSIAFGGDTKLDLATGYQSLTK